jgi:hypothetical protein
MVSNFAEDVCMLKSSSRYFQHNLNGVKQTMYAKVMAC